MLVRFYVAGVLVLCAGGSAYAQSAATPAPGGKSKMLHNPKTLIRQFNNKMDDWTSAGVSAAKIAEARTIHSQVMSAYDDNDSTRAMTLEKGIYALLTQQDKDALNEHYKKKRVAEEAERKARAAAKAAGEGSRATPAGAK